MNTNQNEVLNIAMKAKGRTEEAKEKEGVELAIISCKIEDISAPDVTLPKLEKALKKQFGDSVSFTIKDNEDKSFIIKFDNTNRVYYVESSGNIVGNNNILKISTVEELKAFRNKANEGNTFEGRYIYLMNNITLDKNENWKPINNFKGTFLGNNYSINNLYINKNVADGDSYQFFGLFGDNKGIIQDLNVNGNIDITSYNNNIIIGLISGLNSGTIKRCSSSGRISISGYQENGYIAVGGIIGQNQFGTGNVEKCNNNATIFGMAKTIYVGGIIGSNNNKVCSSYNTGKVEITKNFENSNIWLGGIIGYNGRGSIELCFNIAEIMGDGYIGAICGLIGGSGNVSVRKCKYSNNELNGTGKIDNVPNNYIEIEKDTGLNIEKILEIIQ